MALSAISYSWRVVNEYELDKFYNISAVFCCFLLDSSVIPFSSVLAVWTTSLFLPVFERTLNIFSLID